MSIRRTSLLMPLTLAAGWLLWTLTNVAAWVAMKPADFLNIVRWEAVYSGIGFPVCLLLFLVYAQVRTRLRFGPFVFAAVLLCVVSGMLWRVLVGCTTWWLGWDKGFEPGLSGVLIRGGLVDGTLLGFFTLLFVAIDHRRQLAEQKEKVREATALANQAQLQMLRYQLNPHFLFNALNSIRAMIVEDPSRSRQMVTELADFLRYSLDSDEQESTIGDEIQAIENYLAIQRIRFEQRLEATMQVVPAAQAVTVPCFLIHPLVENAIKYGMQTSAMPLRIEIEVTCHDQELAIRVSNSGRLLANSKDYPRGGTPDGTGTGLKNIAQRLNLVFPDRHTFQIQERDGWVHASIQLQLGARDAHHESAQSPDRG